MVDEAVHPHYRHSNTQKCCSIEGCVGNPTRRGMCDTHYRQWLRTASDDDRKRSLVEHCTVAGCARSALARGLCSMHYQRWVKHGDPLLGGRLPLGESCAVDGCLEKPASATSGQTICKIHNARWHKKGTTDGPLIDRNRPIHPQCTVEGCTEKPVTKYSPYCQTHYLKNRRYGDPLWERQIQQRGVNEDGYEWIFVGSEHHLSSGRSRILYHRFVLFEAIGPGQHPCRWCGRTLEWGCKGARMLVVDHVDGDKGNNDIENLVPSCHKCNINRAVFMDWVKNHIDDPVVRGLFSFQGTGAFVL